MLRLRDFLTRRGDPLQLESLTGEQGLDRALTDAEVASPGLALAGYTGRFAPNRLHVFGETEITYLSSLPADQRRRSLENFFAFELPWAICSGNSSAADQRRTRMCPAARTTRHRTTIRWM